MKYLTTYLDDEINFKFGNNGSIIELKAVDDHAVMSFSNEEKLLIRIKNEESYIKTVPVTAERKIIQLPTKLLKDLTVGQYDVELWQGEGDDQVIYPDEGFLRLKIHGNASQIDGSLVSSITLADFEKKFNELAQKIEDKLEKLPDIDGKNISIDVKVVDGNLCINGKDTGINLTAKDGRDGRDGHTPEITVSDAGTLVVDGIDTNKSLIGPRGENGLPGKDGVAGQDGKSAYQVAVDNGFDGTEVEWLRSLHGNDGLDGKSGRDGLPGQSGKSAYEIAITNGFTGTETEWLESLKGRDGHDGKDANVDLSKYPTKDEIANQYVQRTDLPNIVLDTDQRTLIINNKEIKIPNSIDLSNYAQKSEIPNIVFDVENNMLTINGNEVKIPKDVDLSVYYTKADIDEKLADIQSGGKIDLSSYVNKQELDGYAKKSEMPSTPDLTPYETKENAEKTYATKQALADIQLTPGKDGKNGKSAYDIAKEHGYTDTEENWLKSLKGRDGIDGKSGQNGVNGLSAYEVAQKNGFSGTEQEWLASLRGERGSAGIQGVPGESGKSAYEIWKSLGNSGSEQDFVNSLKGEAGKNGSDGVRGETGQSAYQLWLSKGNSGSEDDFLQSLRGSKGDTGSRGSDGVPGKSGLSAYEIWKNAGHQGTEQDFLNSLRGSQGERGSQGVPGPAGEDGLSAYEVAKRNGFTGTEKEWIDSLRNQNFNKTTINKIFDKYSNKFHINMPDNGFLNDVQGAFYRNGIWHMYFLYNADAKYNVNGDQIGGNGTEWYHVTTKDWVKWNYEGVAIHKYKTAWGDVTSGTIYIDFDNRFGKGKDAVIVFATAYGGDKGQNVMGYYSTDNGYTFSPLQADPILRHVGGSDTNFRDPYLFRMGDTWVIYMAEGDKFGIYTSNNPLSGYNYIDGYFAPHALLECPSLFKLNVNGDQNNQKWVLFYGGNGGDDATTGTYASVGYLTDKYVFKAEQENIRVDYGPDYYGAKMFSNEFNNNDFVYSDAWLGNWGYATKVPNNGRIGAISTTRKITLRNENNKYTLNNEIVGVFPDYLDNPIVGTNLKTNTRLPMFKGDSFYLKFRIKDVRKLNENMTIKLVGNQYDSDMLFNFKDNNVKVHRYNSSFNNNDIYGRDRIFSTNLDKENDLWIELLVDRTCIEMRLSNGDIFTMTKFPAGRSRENICVSADNTVNFDYEYYQIMPQEV